MAISLTDIPRPRDPLEPEPIRDITGIPQAATVDTSAFGQNPWDVEESNYQADLDKWRRDARDKLDQAALDPDNFFKGKDLSFAPDPKQAQILATNDAFLQFQNDGDPLPPGDFNRKVIRAQTAQKLFGGAGADSEESFHAEVVKDATKRKTGKELARDLTVAAFDDAMLPSDQAPGYAAFRKKLKTHAGYDAQNEADYAEAWYETRRAASEKVDAFREPLVQVWRAFRTDGNVTAAAFDAYNKLSPDQRPEFMDALAIRSKALPVEERATFWANMGKATTLSIADYGRNAAESATSMGLAQPTDPGVGIADAVYGGSNYADSESGRKLAASNFQQARNFAADVRRVAREDYDPLKSAFGSGEGKPGFWEGVAYQAPGVTATSLTMAVPVLGLPTMPLALEGSAYETLRGRMMASGLDDATATSYAEGIAPFVAVPQVALEKAGFALWSRQLPGVSKVIDTLGDQISNRLLRGIAKTGTIATAETGIELVQDATSYAVQDIAHALAEDVPDVDWGKELAGTWAQAPEIFFTMLPLAILGAAGGLSQESRNAAFARATPTELQALGIGTDGIAAISAANGPASLATAIDTAMETRNPASEEAQAAVGALKLKLETQRQAQADLERLGYAAPSFVQHAEGITVFDGDGAELGTAPDLSGAVRLARAHTVALDDMEADQVAALVSLMEAAKAAVELDPSSTVDVNLGQFDPSQASPEMAARFAAQVALKEQAEGGTGDIARSVLGYSVTEVAQGVRNTVNRIFRGAAVTDVFHETFHGLRRQARTAGTITRADEISLLRALDQVLAGKTTKDGVQLRFIPENLQDEQIPDVLLDEAFSEIAEMEILRTRKQDGKGKLGLTRGVISRNLTALTKLIPGVAGKWTAFIAAVRARWGLSLSRAIAMKKAERDGTFDKQGYDAYLDKILGLDQQAEHDAGVVSEFDRILGLPDELADDDIPFSIGNDYRIEHQPHPEDAQLSNLSEMFPDDIYGPNAIRYYGSGQAGEREAVAIFRRVRDKPDAPVTIYRVVPEFVEEINPGDWVTISKAAADAMNTPDFIMADNQGKPQQPKVLSKVVKAGDVRWPGDSLLEQGYFPDGDVSFSISGVRTKIITEFIEGSKVQDAVYHGSPDVRGIIKDGFKKSPTRGDVFFFSDDYKTADTYADDRRALDYQNAEPYTLPVYLSVKNPLEVDAKGQKWRNTETHIQQAREGGHDGIIIRNSRDEYNNTGSGGKPVTVYAVFSPSQIKSASTDSIKSRVDGIDLGIPSFSIGPAQVADIMAGNALKRITDPRRRTQVMSRIARDFDAMRLQIDRMASLSGIRRSKGDLRREAMAREDLRAEELIGEVHARFGSLAFDEDLFKIKSQPVHSYLSDPTTPLRGKLMSKAQAIKNHPDQYQLHREGHYDGSDSVSRSVFGGWIHPGDAAQNLFDENLISEPTADAMWKELLKEQASVVKNKDALVKMQEQIREAKAQAKQEANEWLATQGKDQEVNFSDKEEIRRSLRMYDAIMLALPSEARGPLARGYTQISMIATDEAKLAFLKDALAKADKQLETFLRVEYATEWEALLKKAAPATNEPGQRPTGSIAADAYDIFRVAEAAMGMSFATGEAEADKWDAIADHQDTDPKDVDMARVKAQMIRLTMNWSAADAARREQAVLEGEKIYYNGLLALKVENSRRRERLGKLRDSAVNGTGKTGHRMEREAAKQATATKLGAVKAMAWEFLSFGQVVNVLFGEKSAAAQWFNSREIAASNAAHDGFQAKANALESLFDTLSGNRFDGEKLRHRMATDPKIKVQDLLGVNHTFTESQAITFLLMYRQEDGKRHLQGVRDDDGNILSEWAWDDASAATIEAGLSSEARAAMAFLGQSYGEEYGRINAVFRRIWNVSMPRHKMYAPLSVKPVQGKGDTIMDPVSGDSMGAGMTPGSLKNRSFSAIAEPDFKDAFQVYLTHARQMEHFIAYGEFSRDALGIINRRETRNAIEAAGGADASATLSKWVDYFALGGIHGAAMGGAWTKVLGGMLGRISQAALVGRVSVLCMQSLQLAAASFKMPLGSFLTRFAKLTAGRLQWGDTIQSEYIQRRLQQLPPVVRDMMQGMASGTPNRAKYLAGQAGRTIAGADALFTAGTYAIFYDYHLKQARANREANPEAVAHAEAERLTDQVAQPVRTGARSWLEVANAGNPAFRAAWNFSSDPRQKASLMLYEFMRRDQSGSARAMAIGKSTALLWITGGVLQTLMRTVLRDLRNDDDDEIFDERYWSPSRVALQVITGPLGAVPFVGGMLEDATYKATGQFMPQGGMLSFLDQAAGLPKKWSKGKVDPIKDLETLTTAGAGLSGTSAAAASAMHLIRDVVGFIQNLEGPD